MIKKLMPLFTCAIFLLHTSCNDISQKTENQKDNHVQEQTPLQETNKGKTLMAIFAHPDDEIVISPILSKYQKQGVNVRLVIVTDGSNGVTPHANIPAGELLAKTRAEEALCVTATLNIDPPIFLEYTDGDLALK
ncbi:PIG-L family deacetylase, partial [Maribacter sp.]|uniref:PIG-L deacetylase family protein n=1 Tax=Maribacter sp. TaxID=1897614 RepID=UPI0032989F5E